MVEESRFDAAGATYGNFTVERVVPLPELHSTLRELVHGPSQARVLHVENNDPAS